MDPHFYHHVDAGPYIHPNIFIISGQGTVYFYDIRAEKYLELLCGAPVLLEAGPGWLFHDDTYHDFFVGHDYPNAIYTHCYDPAGTRLFTAG